MNLELLRAELAQNAQAIQQLLTGVTQAQSQQRPNPESWSILEVVCHLYDEECEDFRQRVDILLHRPDEKWPPINPQGWITERNYNARDLGEMLEKWAAERQKSLVWLEGLATLDWDTKHPTPFGFEMCAGDMLASWVAHDILHLRQLVELRYARAVGMTVPYDIRYAGDW